MPPCVANADANANTNKKRQLQPPRLTLDPNPNAANTTAWCNNNNEKKTFSGRRRGASGTGAGNLHEPPVQGQDHHAQGPPPVLSPTGAEKPHTHPEAQPAAAAGAQPPAVPALELVQCHSRRQAVRVSEAVDRAREVAGATRAEGDHFYCCTGRRAKMSLDGTFAP